MAKTSIPKPKPAGLQHIEITLKAMGVPFVEEFRFMDNRMFRFDIAIESRKIAIEYEGIHEGKGTTGKSRHTTKLGYSNDCEKYNNAVCLGWKVLRFTAVNYKDAYKFLCLLMPDKS